MKPIGASDFYEVRRFGLVSDLDRNALAEVYLPIIGATSFAIYSCLCNDPSVDNKHLVRGHGDLFARLQLTPGQFCQGMKALEAMGLIRTFVQSSDSTSYCIYCLYSPKSVAEFFADPLLLGTLRKYVPVEEIKRLEEKYALPSLPESVEEVTESFITYFNPDFSETVYQEGGAKLIKHLPGKPTTFFDVREFQNALSAHYLKAEAISDKELAKIESLCGLYNLSSKAIAEHVASCLDILNTYGERVNFQKLEKAIRDSLAFPYLAQDKAEKSSVNSSSVLGQKIAMMDQVAPADFLKFLQNGHRPASSDLNLIDHLALEMGLSNPAINALIDYALQKNGNVLSRAYCEKIAAGLVRAGVKTAQDAMEYLNAPRKKARPQTTKPTYTKNPQNTPVKPAPVDEEEEEETVSEEEFQAALASLYNK